MYIMKYVQQFNKSALQVHTIWHNSTHKHTIFSQLYLIFQIANKYLTQTISKTIM